DVMQGPDVDDPVCADRPADPAVPALAAGLGGLRIATAGGYFHHGLSPEGHSALAVIAAALRATRAIQWPEAARARAAAYVITCAEGAAFHIDRLRTRPHDFDPAVRDRLIAGAMVPTVAVAQAQKFRRWYRDRVLALFEEIDAVLLPATPCTAPRIGQQTFKLDSGQMPVRANL